MAKIKWFEKFAIKPFTEENGTDCLGLCFAQIYYSGKIMVHTVSEDEKYRLDIIAWKYLNEPSMWRFIAGFNNLFDPIGEVLPQKTLFIPTSNVDLTSVFIPNTYLGAV